MRFGMVVLAASIWGAQASFVPASGGETIVYSYSSTGLCSRCASYTVELRPDGRGVFTGVRNTAVSGKVSFHTTPRQARRFTERLRQYRPDGEQLMNGPPICKQMATDQDSIDIWWQRQHGRRAHLDFYGGCDMDANGALAKALFSAATLLPISGFIERSSSGR